jgi:hypothetical protein
MVSKRWMITTLAGILLLGLAACGGGASPGEVVEDYLAAVVAKDDVASVNLSCLEWEVQARAEGAAFDANEVALEDVSCQAVEENAETAIVNCTGRIRFSYDGGVEEHLVLEGRNFRTIVEDGEWKMCGYQ